ncbi:MAG: hypothetical protein NC194_04230 [Prevotella sp.]|nr:hypothetical protein [Bacteroides sp.]MCM1437084.1 hypothetical protein [Prevotella sp.]
MSPLPGSELINEKDKELIFPIIFIDSTATLNINLRVKNLHGKSDHDYSYWEGEKKRRVKNPAWGLMMISDEDSLRIKFRPENEQSVLGSSSERLGVDIIVGDSIVKREVFKSKFSVLEENLVVVERKKDDWKLRYGDGAELNQLLFKTAGTGIIKEVCIILEPGSGVEISSMSLKSVDKEITSGELPMDKIRERLENSSDALEGVWQIYDYEIEETFLKRPDKLTLGILRNGDSYEIYYLEGYVEKSCWRRGMLKGKLRPSIFDGIYDVEWIDAEFLPMSKGITGSVDYPVLKLDFTPQESTLRLRKVNKESGKRFIQ